MRKLLLILISVAWPSLCFAGLDMPPALYAAGTNVAISGNVITASTAGQIGAVRVVTAAGDVTVSTTDYAVALNKTVGAATVVNLPNSPTAGQVFVIKDAKGDAAANNITVTPASGTIEGAGTYVMNLNYQSVTVFYNGASWSVM